MINPRGRRSLSVLIAGLALVFASGVAVSAPSDSKSSSTSTSKPSTPPSPPKSSFGGFSAPAKKESTPPPAPKPAPAPPPAARVEKKEAPTSFGAFGAPKPAAQVAATPPAQVARPVNSMARDLEATAARNNAINTYDERRTAQAAAAAAKTAQDARDRAAAARQSAPPATASTQPRSNDSLWGRRDPEPARESAYEREQRERRLARAREEAHQDELDTMARRARRAELDADMARAAAQREIALARERSRNANIGTGVAIGTAGAVLTDRAEAAAPAPTSGGYSAGVGSRGLDAMAGVGPSGAAPAVQAANADSDGFPWGAVFLALIVIAAIAGGLYYWLNRKKPEAKGGRYAL